MPNLRAPSRALYSAAARSPFLVCREVSWWALNTACSQSSDRVRRATAARGASLGGAYHRWLRVLDPQDLAGFQIFFHAGSRAEAEIDLRRAERVAIQHRPICFGIQAAKAHRVYESVADGG